MSGSAIFFKAGSFSHVNANVRIILEREFPGVRIRTIDVMSDILKRQPKDVMRALVDVLRIYPREIFLRRRKPTDFILRTPAAFRAIKTWVSKHVRQEETEFTFQTQSLFDASLPGIPHFLFTDHTCMANRRYAKRCSEEYFNPRWIALERTAYESARLVFTTSHFARHSLTEDYGMAPDRVVCTYSGTNVIPYTPSQKAFRGVILFVGVDWERKGGRDLLKAFEEVAARFPEARLHIVGCSPAVSHPRVQTFGLLPLDQVARQLAEADIFCLPSYFEPSPAAVVEAMHYGLPTVGTRVGGMPDRILDGETGLMVEPGDIAGLATALGSLLGDPKRCRAMGEKGRQRARAIFTWEATGQRLGDSMRQALNRDGYRVAPAPIGGSR